MRVVRLTATVWLVLAVIGTQRQFLPASAASPPSDRSLAAAPDGAALAGHPTVRVHFSVTGGLRVTRTLVHSISAGNYGCVWDPHAATDGTGYVYQVEYDKSAVPALIISADVFGLSLFRYSPGRSHVFDPHHDEIIVQAASHIFDGIAGQPPHWKFGLTVHVARDGRSGTFRATHLAAGTLAGTTAPVDIQGSWRCSVLSKF